jgi:dihydroorotate dehydrogenase
MIFQWPQLIGHINKWLTKLLEADGYHHISEAIGAYHKE